jgi:ADP-ribose pyrophosphatase YjhB (NUDIX family)
MFKIGIFAIILDEQKRVLLCHRRDYDLWNLPGGGLEKDESPWDGVIREVKEEVGLDVKVTKLQGVYSKPDNDEIVFSFFCIQTGGKIRLTDEADEIKYFKINDIPKNISPKQIERIKDALNSDKLVLKDQKGPSSIDLIKQGKL